MESKQRVLAILALDLVFCFCFFVTAGVSHSACFLVVRDTGKCVEGGAHNLFSISQGQTFHLVTSTALFCGHGVWALRTLRGSPSVLTFGMLLASFYLVSLIALSNSAIWGSFSTSVSGLDCSNLPTLNGTTIGLNDTAVELKCNGYNAAFSALSVLSSLIFLCNGAASLLLHWWQQDFLPHGGMILGGGESGGGGGSTDEDDEMGIPRHHRQREHGNDVYDSMAAGSSSSADHPTNQQQQQQHRNIFLSSPPSQSQFEPTPTNLGTAQHHLVDVEESFMSTDTNN